MIAAAGDRHLAEFVPEYLKDPETVQEWGYALTPIEYRIENKKDLNEKSMAYASGKSPIPIEPSGEEGVVQIKALLGLGEIVTNVNLPNKGQLEASHEIVVETNALFSRYGRGASGQSGAFDGQTYAESGNDFEGGSGTGYAARIQCIFKRPDSGRTPLKRGEGIVYPDV